MEKLHVVSQECNGCGAWLYPPDAVSDSGVPTYIQFFLLEEDAKGLEAFLAGKAENISVNAPGTGGAPSWAWRVRANRLLAVLEPLPDGYRLKCPKCGFVTMTVREAKG